MTTSAQQQQPTITATTNYKAHLQTITNMLRSCLSLLGQPGLLPAALQHASRFLPCANVATSAAPPYKQSAAPQQAQATAAAARPKRSPSGYNLFVKEKAPEVKGAVPAGSTIMKELGRMWTAMSDEDKRPWNDQADALKGTTSEVRGVRQQLQ